MEELNPHELRELLERLDALENQFGGLDWRLLNAQAEMELTPQGLKDIAYYSRIFSLVNPLIARVVALKRLYVWGSGWTVKAATPEIQAAIDAFLYDESNKEEVGTHQARMLNEVARQTDGNLFFAFFPSIATGRVRIRQIPFAEIADIITNPDDRREVWYYRRDWSQGRFEVETGVRTTEAACAYYPDYRYNPKAKPPTINGRPVRWESPVLHVKSGGFPDWLYGISELYAQLPWAKAYKEFLENWASIVKAYTRFAWHLKTPGNQSTLVDAKNKIANTPPGLNGAPPPGPTTGSTFVSNPNVTMEPFKTQGATVAAEDGRRMLLMVAAGAGLPETYFGDASVGTLATAKSLDRPTELMMIDIQTFWRDVYLAFFGYLLRAALRTANHALRTVGRLQSVVEDERLVEWIEWNEDIDPTIRIDFPPIVQHEVKESVGAVISAATLDGKPLTNTLDIGTVRRLLLQALGVADADEILEQLADLDAAPRQARGPEGEPVEPDPVAATERMFLDTIKQVRDGLQQLIERGAQP